MAANESPKLWKWKAENRKAGETQTVTVCLFDYLFNYCECGMASIIAVCSFDYALLLCSALRHRTWCVGEPHNPSLGVSAPWDSAWLCGYGGSLENWRKKPPSKPDDTQCQCPVIAELGCWRGARVASALCTSEDGAPGLALWAAVPCVCWGQAPTPSPGKLRSRS